VSYIVLNKDDLQHDGTNYEFQGYLHGDTNVSFIWIDLPPGAARGCISIPIWLED
jgi:hypothetical protein